MTEVEMQEAFEDYCRDRMNWSIAKLGNGYRYPMQQAAYDAFIAGFILAGGKLK